jgi:hypothetical protein
VPSPLLWQDVVDGHSIISHATGREGWRHACAALPSVTRPDKKLVLQGNSGNRTRRMTVEILVPASVNARAAASDGSSAAS